MNVEKFREVLIEKWFSPAGFIRCADVNGDGKIDVFEFSQILINLGINVGESKVKDFFQEFDSQRDGFLDLHELTLALVSEDSRIKMKQENTSKSFNPKMIPDDLYVALVAHNEMKDVLIKFVEQNHDFFSSLPIVTTGSTGRALEGKLGIKVDKLVASGPLGGDQAIGGMISEKKIGGIFFFQDPLSSHPHAFDIEALTRLCDVHQIPYATNPSSAVGLMMTIESYGLAWVSDSAESLIVKKYKEKQAQVIQKSSS